jgi:hypothetical protein
MNAGSATSLAVRHMLPSAVLSLDDEPHRPSARLVDLTLAAGRRAWEIGFPGLRTRVGPETRGYLEVWPGEHYRLLAALVDVLQPALVVEIGTATGASALAMKEFLPAGGRIVTYDVVPWAQYPGVDLVASDLDHRLEQRLVDLSDPAQAPLERDLLEQADFIFVDAAKDGVMELHFCELFDRLSFRSPPIVLFDDIRMMNMIGIWRSIRHPKLDLTSFGHWSGTGLVEWA